MTIYDDVRRFRRFALSRRILLGWAIFLSVVVAVPWVDAAAATA